MIIALRLTSFLMAILIIFTLFSPLRTFATTTNDIACAVAGTSGGTCFFDPQCANLPDFNLSCACTTSSTSPSSTLTGNDNVQKSWNYFKSKGLSDAVVAAIVGNLQDETGLSIDPQALQKGGRSQNPADEGPSGGWGIAQWSDPATKVLGIAKQYHVSGPIYELATQLDIVWAEMNGTSPNGVSRMIDSLKNINDAGQAAAFFDNNFEGGVMGNRIINATALYNKRDQLNSLGSASSPSSASAAGSATSTTTGNGSTGTTTSTTDTLEGHKLPAISGGTGNEDPVDPSGHLTTTGGAVTFAQFASMGTSYRDFYITMRWRYALWNWDGTSTTGPENSAWYGQKPRLVLVTNPRNHKSIIADIMESGPAPWTGVDTNSNNTPKQGWKNPQDGTPPNYKGRVTGFPPPAIQALGAIQTESNGSGDKLDFAWAPDQSAKPGPTNLQATGGTNGGTGSGNCGTSGDGTSYQNPFKDVHNIVQSGVDAGVDYNGDGPVHPIGPATVDVVEPNSPWSGGNYISYTVNGGPADGKDIFVAEICKVNTALHKGQSITPSDTLCTMTGSGSGIESGWANKGIDLPLAYTDHCYYLTNPSLPKTSTAYGTNFNQLMHSLGAPNASLLGGQVTCTLPQGWPASW